MVIKQTDVPPCSPLFRPRSPADDSDTETVDGAGPTTEGEFNAESFHSHQEALLAMQRHQMELLMKVWGTGNTQTFVDDISLRP